ncbi:MAG: molybdopterin-dependent oxidoreductase, partial [Deltaproteobacteria bacterium]|nr:molybdopterin-dependent oxidoreductase [Deltaproteobacteria bacterium]
MLDDLVTPADRLFVRNNGLTPENPDPRTWTLEIGGESVIRPKTYTLAELKSKFTHHTYALTIECGA